MAFDRCGEVGGERMNQARDSVGFSRFALRFCCFISVIHGHGLAVSSGADFKAYPLAAR
jgi:hypothetical protein